MKFLEQVFAAKTNNGWWHRESGRRCEVCILSGPWTGEWTIESINGQKRVKYLPVLSGLLPHKGKYRTLATWRTEYIKTNYGAYHGKDSKQIWWVVSQIAGADHEETLQALKEEPRRGLARPDVRSMLCHLASYKDRQKFCRQYLLTWSIKKSLPAWTRRVPWDLSRPVDLGYLRWLPSDWRRDELVARALAQWAKEKKMRWTSSRKMITLLLSHLQTSTDVSHTKDILNQASSLADQREETLTLRNGRDILAAWDAEQWVRLLNMGEQIQHSFRQVLAMRTTSDDAEAQAKHEEFGLVLPEGVRHLITKQDFINEGEAMRHCVAGYFHQTNYWYFNTGTSTLQVSRKGQIVQHRGVANCVPGKDELEIGRQIAKLIKG